MSAPTVPQVPKPVGAAEVTDWIDLQHGADGHRCFTGPRHEIAEGQFVEASGVQNVAGELECLSVRAQIDLWGMNHHEHWDHELSPPQARFKAAELRHQAALLILTAAAYEAAATEVDGWAQR